MVAAVEGVVVVALESRAELLVVWVEEQPFSDTGA